VKLPLWRLVLGVSVLVAMVAILLTLMPVYFENYQLGQFVRQLARNPDAPNAEDDKLRAAVVARARELDLPVRPGDIQIARSEGKLQLETKYAVQMDFPLYQVDLHFHANGASR
jgi:hypothetical protein